FSRPPRYDRFDIPPYGDIKFLKFSICNRVRRQRPTENIVVPNAQAKLASSLLIFVTRLKKR
ncbi:MAG: hypothetical protein U0M06_01570, partial [Clostridia bacterium]|nr:hypothetical protein [Clostridia bacterium]